MSECNFFPFDFAIVIFTGTRIKRIRKKMLSTLGSETDYLHRQIIRNISQRWNFIELNSLQNQEKLA